MVVYNKLSYLTDDTRAAAEQFLAILRANNLSPVVVETYREQARQDYLYEHNGPGKVPHKTNSRKSWHVPRRALDVDISPAGVDEILFFLDTARALGFSTVPDPAKIRSAIAAHSTPDLWDWHHVSFHGGKTLDAAYAEDDELLQSGPRPSLGIAQLVGLVVSAVTVIGFLYHANKKKPTLHRLHRKPRNENAGYPRGNRATTRL